MTSPSEPPAPPVSRRARQQQRRRRREQIAGAVVIVVGIVVAIVAIVALREPNGHNRPAASPTTAASGTRTPSGTSSSKTPSKAPSSRPTKTRSSSSSSGTGTAAKLPLVVLNNTTTSGLAQQAAQTFRSGGWTITRYGNYSNDIVSTCAYYDPATPGAEDAAKALQAQFPAIKRVKEKFDGLPDGPIVVVLTLDYSG